VLVAIWGNKFMVQYLILKVQVLIGLRNYKLINKAASDAGGIKHVQDVKVLKLYQQLLKRISSVISIAVIVLVTWVALLIIQTIN
jgi:hypothetical protein